MSTLSCPHCQATISSAGFSPGQLVACGHCGGTLQIPQVAQAVAVEMPLASRPPVPSAPAISTAAPYAPSPVATPARAAMPVPAPVQAAAPAPATAGASSAASRVRSRKKRNPFGATFIVLSLTGGLVGGGIGVGVFFLSQGTIEVGGQDAVEEKPPVLLKQRGGRVQLEQSGYKAPGTVLPITRSEFRDRVEAFSFDLDTRTSLRWFHSGQAFVDAFGQPSRLRTVRDELHYCWNCSDGTVSLVTEPSAESLEQRNSADGSKLIVLRIDNEFH
jgi:hypothetical protein